MCLLRAAKLSRRLLLRLFYLSRCSCAYLLTFLAPSINPGTVTTCECIAADRKYLTNRAYTKSMQPFPINVVGNVESRTLFDNIERAAISLQFALTGTEVVSIWLMLCAWRLAIENHIRDSVIRSFILLIRVYYCIQPQIGHFLMSCRCWMYAIPYPIRGILLCQFIEHFLIIEQDSCVVYSNSSNNLCTRSY